MKNLIESVGKQEHKADYPVIGGARVCAYCGEQNYTTKYCFEKQEKKPIYRFYKYERHH